MKFTQSIRFLLAGSAALLVPTVVALEDGEEICVQGFVMDNFCIRRGTLLDMSTVVTLQNPELHTFHCTGMIDPQLCPDSGYAVLGAPPFVGADCAVDFVFDSSSTTLEKLKFSTS
jgi:hypothetical protein